MRILCFLVATTVLGGPAVARAGDLGRAVFERDCFACHSVIRQQNRVGPSLFGVVGRPAASISSYVYSSALRESPLVWDEPALEAFLTAPQVKVPGTAMRFSGIKDGVERAALIAYLKKL